MAIAQISSWLKNPDRHYQAGVSLFQQYGTKKLLKAFFANGDSPSHQARLFTELEELNLSAVVSEQPVILSPAKAAVATPAAPLLPAAASVPLPRKSFSLSDDEWAKTPDAIKDLYTRVSQLKSHSDLAFHRLHTATSDDERLQLARVRLFDNAEINRAWKSIKEYHATGKITEQLQAESIKSVDLLNLQELVAVLMNYPTYISKAKGRIKIMPEGAKKTSAQTELQEKEIYLDAAKTRVANGKLV